MMAEENQSIAAIVKRARAIKGISQPELARRVGTSQQTIDKIETGKVQRSSFLAAIALELGVPLDRVLRVPPKSNAVGEMPAHKLISADRDLPVYATVTQGDNGLQVLSSDPVEYVARPAPLARVRDAYGVIVADDSMAPEVESGDIALINPHMPARAGDTCVFRSAGQDGAQRSCIKRVRKLMDKDWHVTEWSGEHGRRDFMLKRADWPVAHVTIGYFKRR
jgi:transcriptional regulator with XRE-family HTH domain